MGKGGKLTKLRSAFKKWPSFTKLDHTINGKYSIAAVTDDSAVKEATGGLYPVYVGRSRRRYLVSSDVIEHPLFQVLINKSDGSDGVSVACEVVLFEHLLWMLENADSVHLDSMDDLVEFYRKLIEDKKYEGG
ncbi:hypothetical protein F0562_022748 [Nyssa sinensis]|uniref:Uncharacterized protein n=1 Tax=Nyssa sinensis TaxID=561372 RepID=A0A5J5BG49_9ASTE|nr:hypothetical protein F0562_022748 [Nyssa sinensis]